MQTLMPYETVPKNTVLFIATKANACPTVDGWQDIFPGHEVTVIPGFSLCHCVLRTGYLTKESDLRIALRTNGLKNNMIAHPPGHWLNPDATFNVLAMKDDIIDFFSRSWIPGLIYKDDQPGLTDPENGIPSGLKVTLGIVIAVGIGLIAIGLYLRFGKGGK